MSRLAVCASVLLITFGAGAHADSILFVGNSFTYGYGSPVMFYRPDSVTDLNGEGIGGVPALFKSFSVELGLTYDVFLETHPAATLGWHADHKLDLVARQPWDHVVLQDQSVLDPKNPGDPAAQAAASATLARALRKENPQVDIRLVATWPLAAQLYQPGGHWYGQAADAMAADLRAGTDKAAATDPAIKGVLPVGEAWVRAFRDGIADPNPYDGTDAARIDLWGYDHHHASTYGYYLEALVLFGGITERDPRSLGATECAGYELGLSMEQVMALEKVAFDQLAAEGTLKPSDGPPRDAVPLSVPAAPRRCTQSG
jgi:hypothetical protein